MKAISTIMLLLLLGSNGFGQNPNVINLSKLSFNGISSTSSENNLIEVFGKADSIFNPLYDCGPLSPEWNNVEVLAYQFEGMRFHIVNDQLEIDELNIKQTKPNLIIEYGGVNISGKGVSEKLKNLFPVSYLNWEKNKKEQFILLPCEYCDSEIWLWIENDMIVRIKYHHPC